MLPDASEMLLLLKVDCKPFKDVVRTHTQWLDRSTKLRQEFLVSQEGDTHREQLLIVMDNRQYERHKILADGCCARLMRLEHLLEGWHMLSHKREEDVFFMVEMPVERAFRQTDCACNLLGGHMC